MHTKIKEIYSEMLAVEDLSDKKKSQMLDLMKEFYDNIEESTFNEDLDKKDYCIILYDYKKDVIGFSYQEEVSLKLDGKTIRGIFSGDTIIHKDHWGSSDLFKQFARAFIKDNNEEYYWFLISKGYKTYKMLPLFFKEFYPNYKKKTPGFEKEIIDLFGKTKYPSEYDQSSGVINYKGIKDRLKDGVADITEKQLKDEDIKHFYEINPDYIKGKDLVCITKLNRENLRNTAKRLFRDE